MSAGYSMEYRVVIKGTKAEFEQIPALAKNVPNDYNENLAEDMAKIMKITKGKSGEKGEPHVMEMAGGFSSYNSDMREVFEFFLFLDALDQGFPNFAIAVYVIWVDTEYGGPDTISTLYSPKGSSALDMKNFSDLIRSTVDFPSSTVDFPNEDWIPYGWRHPKEKAPAAKTKGTITLLGEWGEAETSIVDKALMGGALEAMGYTAFPGEDESVRKAKDGWEFHVGGAVDAGEAAQNLHLALLTYIEEHKASYAALCKTMREKKLAIHLYSDEYTGPNAAWNYCNHSAWRFLITSDGTRLVSKLTWRETYALGSRGGSDYSGLYRQATGKANWKKLSDEARFLASQAICSYNVTHKAPEDVSGLKSALEKALKKAGTPAPPVRFIPQTFDQRFAGQTFIVKGGLDGYEEGQVKEIIEQFGGKVGRNVTAKTAYFVCGSGVGDPFKTALKHGTPLLSADYFEDMTR